MAEAVGVPVLVHAHHLGLLAQSALTGSQSEVAVCAGPTPLRLKHSHIRAVEVTGPQMGMKGFFALNGPNQCVAWQFCRNQRHATIRDLLTRLSKRGKTRIVCTDQAWHFLLYSRGGPLTVMQLIDMAEMLSWPNSLIIGLTLQCFNPFVPI